MPNHAYPTPAEVAEAFHHAYESLAPEFGYETRTSSRVPWDRVPTMNQRLMIAVVRAVMIEKFDLLRPEKDRHDR